MKNTGIEQVHIIPFDLGCVFYDCLSLNNSRNLAFAKLFNNKLVEICKTQGIIIEDNIELKYLGKTITGIKYKNNALAESAICIAHIMPHLKCYVLANGIGVFVLADFEGRALNGTDPSIFSYSKALIANYQKKISQATILNRYKGKDVLPEEEKAMLAFREICWHIVNEGVKKKKTQHARKYSGSKTYKAEGLSYVLTIYLIKENELTRNEFNHLMRSTVFSKVTDKNEWDSIHKTITETECEDSATTLKVGDSKSYYSWSAVAVEIKENLKNYDEMADHPILSVLIKAELYVQSRWFMADNSMDNINKNMDCSMEGLQRLASLIEYSQAELENDISANMNTLYKKVLNQVVITSEVKQLYKSVASQINTQKKIKEAQYQDKKKKNNFIMDLFLAVFSASSLYKTVWDLVNDSFGWVNWAIFGAMMFVATGTIIFNYKNK